MSEWGICDGIAEPFLFAFHFRDIGPLREKFGSADGLSGSPVVQVRLSVVGGLDIKLAGMVVRGSLESNIIRAISADVIIQFLRIIE
jgi:hypothetical protein